MVSETVRLRLQVVDPAADAQELDEATARLRNELLELDVVAGAAEAGEAAEGTRAVLSFTLGGLVISLAGTELLASIVNAVTAWLSRHQHRSVKLEIDGDVLELTGIPSTASCISPPAIPPRARTAGTAGCSPNGASKSRTARTARRPWPTAGRRWRRPPGTHSAGPRTNAPYGPCWRAAAWGRHRGPSGNSSFRCSA